MQAKKGNAVSLIEAHDQPMMERVGRYIKEDEIIKERFIEGLKPKHKKTCFQKQTEKKCEEKKLL